MVPIRYLLNALSLILAGLLAAVASNSPSTARDRVRLDVNWMVERGDYTYRLRGRYSIASVSDEFATSVASEANFDAPAAHVYVPTGVYSVTLERGYTLERIAAPASGAGLTAQGASIEVVPASIVSQNPVLVVAQEGRVIPIGLSLVELPGATAEPASCLSGA